MSCWLLWKEWGICSIMFFQCGSTIASKHGGPVEKSARSPYVFWGFPPSQWTWLCMVVCLNVSLVINWWPVHGVPAALTSPVTAPRISGSRYRMVVFHCCLTFIDWLLVWTASIPPSSGPRLRKSSPGRVADVMKPNVLRFCWSEHYCWSGCSDVFVSCSGLI